MGYRKAMVTYDTLVKIIKDDQKISMESADTLTQLYEAGMSEILREIGYRIMLDWEETRRCSDEEHDLSEQVQDVFKHLQEQLSDDKKLFEYEEQFNSLRAIEQEEAFLAGFIAGYRFLKKRTIYSKELVI
jgi:vacuolar-type H+-ATPase subunit I/STV1